MCVFPVCRCKSSCVFATIYQLRGKNIIPFALNLTLDDSFIHCVLSVRVCLLFIILLIIIPIRTYLCLFVYLVSCIVTYLYQKPVLRDSIYHPPLCRLHVFYITFPIYNSRSLLCNCTDLFVWERQKCYPFHLEPDLGDTSSPSIVCWLCVFPKCLFPVYVACFVWCDCVDLFVCDRNSTSLTLILTLEAHFITFYCVLAVCVSCVCVRHTSSVLETIYLLSRGGILGFLPQPRWWRFVLGQ